MKIAQTKQAPITKLPPKSGGGKVMQRKVMASPGNTPGVVQRKASAGSWMQGNTLRAVNARPQVQPKARIGPADDHFEKEADHVADKVVSPSTSSPPVRITSVNNGFQKKLFTQAKIKSFTGASLVQTRVGHHAADSSPPTSSQSTAHPVDHALGNQDTRGSPLPSSTRHHMEGRIGADFSQVRIHTGQESQAANASIGARAFTNGPHIHFAGGQYDPHTAQGKHLLAHELTHTVQQGASTPVVATKLFSTSSLVQRAAINQSPSEEATAFSHERGPPSSSSEIVQCSLIDPALDRIGELLDDLPPFTTGLDGALRWLRGKMRRFASFIPGYTALGVIIGHDPITGDEVERTGRNFIEAALDIVPGGSLLKQKLEELGAIDRAAAWIDGQLDSLMGIIGGIRAEFLHEWNELTALSILRGPRDIIRSFGNIFERALNNLVSFARRAASELLDIIKKFLLTQIVDFIKNHTTAYELLKVIIGHDPVTEEHVDRNGTNILNALLELGGEQGREQRRQMEDTGTFRKAADWIDRGILVFGNLYETIRNNFGMIWNAVSIQTLMDPVGTFTRIYETFADPVRRVLAFVEEAVLAILALIKEVLLQRLSTWARTVRGYPLVTVLIGKDPFTNVIVPRSIPNIIRGFMSLMEGGEEQYRQMEESGAIANATQRIEAAVARLNMTPAYVIQLFTDLWNSFSFRDLAHPIDAFHRILERFGEPIGRLFAFIVEIVKIVVEIILHLMNFPFDLINNIIRRSMQAFERIKRDPIGFLKNLLRAIKQGFIQFFDHIVTHLINGVVGWLMSELRDANLPPLTDFSLRGIIAWTLQVLGISMEAIWEKLAQHPRVGPQRVARLRSMINTLEGIWTFIRDVQERGMAAIWEKIQEQLSNLWDTILNAVKGWIMDRVVSQVTARLLSMLDPTGIMAVINSAMAIYRAIQSFMRYLRQMLEIVNSFVNGVADIAEGNVTTAANYMERTMDRGMPVVIGFLANQVGLSGIGRRIGEMLPPARAMVDRALTWLVNRAVNTAMNVIDRLMAMGRSARDAVLGWLGLRKEFRTDAGEDHTLFFEGSGRNARLMMASETGLYEAHIDRMKNAGQILPGKIADYNLAKTKFAELETRKAAQAAAPANTAPDDTAMVALVNDIARLTASFMPPTVVPVSTMPIYHMGTNPAGFGRGVKVERMTKNGPAGTSAASDHPIFLALNKRRQPRRASYVRGHLLSRSYHGIGTEIRNLAPMQQYHNQNFELHVERSVKEKYDAGRTMYVEVVVDYGRPANPNKAAIVNAEPDPAKKLSLAAVIDAEINVPTAVSLVVDEFDTVTNQRKMNSILHEERMDDIQNTSYSEYTVLPKLHIHSAHDPYEHEADRVADHVTSGNALTSSNSISRIPTGLQRKSGDVDHSAGSAVASVIGNEHSRGSPLPVQTRMGMENSMGADFSNVRIHTGADAQAANASIGAKAFTHGSNIYFASGQYDTQSKGGNHLLAHELTHTVQQGASSASIQKANAPAAPATPNKSGGHSLAEDARGYFEDYFKTSLEGIHIHTDNEAARLCRMLHVKAFTEDKHIFIDSANYNPDSEDGAVMLAAELSKALGRTVSKEGATSSFLSDLMTQIRTAAKEFQQGDKINHASRPQPASETKEKKRKGQGGKNADHAKHGKKKHGDGMDEHIPNPAAKTPKNRAPASPAEDAKFLGVIRKARMRAKDQKQHDKPGNKADEAQHAAGPVENEAGSKAQDRKALAMGEAGSKDIPFDAATFKTDLLAKIEEVTPKNLKEANEFKEENRIGEVKSAMGSKVTSQKKTTVGPVDEATAEPLHVNNAENKIPGKLPPTEAGAPPASIGAKDASPKKKWEEEISMKSQSDSLDDEMKANKISEDQLQGSNEPTFQAAVKEKRAAQKDAVEKPLQYRKEEAAGVKLAGAEAQTAAGSSLANMHHTRDKNFGATVKQQQVTKTKDELAREEVAKNINDKYQAAEKEVTKLLGEAEANSNEQFEKGSESARLAFENYVDEKMRAYKRKRYSGYFGGLRWAKDKLFGMPGAVNEFYKLGREQYLARMDAVITGVANTVTIKLNAAKKAIVDGKKDIQDYVKKLPKNLEDVGKEAAGNINDKFDSLEQTVNDKRQQLIDGLSRKYVDNVKKLDERIAELKEANKGFVQKAIGMLKAVWEAIKNIYQLFKTILAKLVSIIGVIIGAPGVFFDHLGAAFRQGFDRFKSRLGEHLENGLMAWLSSQLGVADLKLPEKFDVSAIFSMALQIMGISYEHIRERAVLQIGEERVALMETTAGVFQRIYKEGLGAVWDIIQEKFTDFKDMVWESIKTFIKDAVINAALVFLLSLLNPVAAFIKACMAIYDFIMMLVRMKDRILELLNSIVDAVMTIASGSVDAAAIAIEKALAKSIPIIIGFLAALLHLNNIGAKVRDIITRIRNRVDKLIDWMIGKAYKLVGPAVEAMMRVKNKGKQMIEKGKEKLVSAGKGVVNKVAGWLGLKKEFKTSSGEKHTLFFEGSGKNVSLMMASETGKYEEHIDKMKNGGKILPNKIGDYNAAKAKLKELNTRKEEQLASGTTAPDNGEIVKLVSEIATLTASFMAPTEIPISTMPIYHAGTNPAGFGRGLKVERMTKNGPEGTDAKSNHPVFLALTKRRQPNRTAYVRGHLLSKHFHGIGTEIRNLAPMQQYHNQNFELHVEKLVKQKFDAGRILYVEIIVDYGRSPNPNKTAIVNAEPDPGKKSSLAAVIDAEINVPTAVTVVVDEFDPVTNQRKMNSILEEERMDDIQDTSYSQYTIQPKLHAPKENDPFEKEADNAADGAIRDQEALSKNLSLQNSSLPGKKISLNNQSGQSLPDASRIKLEKLFGADFSRVRIHTNNETDNANKQFGARAFTQGHDIYFEKGQYEPGSRKGEHLLAHELAHTIQQKASPRFSQEKNPAFAFYNNRTIRKGRNSNIHLYRKAKEENESGLIEQELDSDQEDRSNYITKKTGQNNIEKPLSRKSGVSITKPGRTLSPGSCPLFFSFIIITWKKIKSFFSTYLF